jgi:hypothetical protein
MVLYKCDQHVGSFSLLLDFRCSVQRGGMRARCCAASGNGCGSEPDAAGRGRFHQRQRFVLGSADGENRVVFSRIWGATLYILRYRFELFEKMGQLQLTRYRKDQLYDWHMDLGEGPMSQRKISVVVELGAGGYHGGGSEVFDGEETDNRIASRTGRRTGLSVLHHAPRTAGAERYPLDLDFLADRPRAAAITGRSRHK